MKRKLEQISAAALAGAASLMFANLGHAAITVVGTKVGSEVVNGGLSYDIIDFDLTGLSGNDALGNPLSSTTTADPGVDAMTGTFVSSVANALGVPGNNTSGNAANWTKYLNSSLPTVAGSTATPGGPSGTAYDYSFVNFDGGPTGATRSNTGTGTVSAGKVTAIGGNSTSFSAAWYTTDTAIEPSTGPNPNPLIAQILVLHGDGVTFTGSYTGDYSSAVETTSFSYSGTTTTPTGGTNKIVSLVTTAAPTGTAPNGYGAAPLGTLTVTNAGGTGKYFPGYFNVAGGAATGFIAVKGFLPADVPEVYALQVAINGVELLPTDTRLASIIADIEGSDSNISSGVTTVLGSPYAALFPGYDIIVPTSIAGGSTPYFAWDFSSATDSDTALGAVTVTSVAAVPEPATAAGLVLGAAGLLLGRRKNRVQAV